MAYTGGELRRSFLDFFKSRGHTIHPSAPLVPHGDPSLLFTGAGMNQFKDMFLGSRRLPFTRATTVQKCLRTGDIEKVGRTAAHHTFFEMLGNFSFGDYFKEEAIAWAWEYMTRVLGIPGRKLWASVFIEDEEAARIWKRFLPADRIVRFGEEDNFWPANARTRGPSGPCGPCSEIYYDFADVHPGCGRSECSPACDCGRFVEIWNLVFMQYERREGGELVPLGQKNIDTGMGLERLTAVLEGVYSNFDTDLFRPLVDALGPAGADRARVNRMADHLRAVSFCIAEGIVPSNEERGYVVRRLLRAAIRDGWLLGRKDPFLYRAVPVVVERMGQAYPELGERVDAITMHVKAEEARFLRTIEEGMARLSEELDALRRSGSRILAGEKAFRLYDTYGFPVEITRSILEEKGLTVDVEGFHALLQKQREQSRRGARFTGEVFERGALREIRERFPPTEYVGEKKLKDRVTVLAIVRGEELVERAEEGAGILVLCDRTPFYAEGGGQVGDTGVLKARNAVVEVTDTQGSGGYILHRARVARGVLRKGDRVTAEVNARRRADITRNHDATHLLQAALRRVLGPHVEQRGSVVAPHLLRFDFSHPKPMTEQEIEEVERLVNEKILADVRIHKFIVPLEEARKMGALMLFGEKYGERVRVVKTADDFSVELCGGSHGDHTSAIGCFRIVSESSIGAGIRRIEAVTGAEAVRHARQQEKTIQAIGRTLGTTSRNRDELVRRVAALQQEVKRLRKGERGLSRETIEKVLRKAREINGTRVAAHVFDEGLRIEQVRSLMDALLQRGLGAALVCVKGERAFGIVAVHRELIDRGLKAGELAKELAGLCGGSGGGKPHMAQFGIKDAGRIPAAAEAFERSVAARLSSTQH